MRPPASSTIAAAASAAAWGSSTRIVAQPVTMTERSAESRLPAWSSIIASGEMPSVATAGTNAVEAPPAAPLTPAEQPARPRVAARARADTSTMRRCEIGMGLKLARGSTGHIGDQPVLSPR